MVGFGQGKRGSSPGKRKEGLSPAEEQMLIFGSEQLAEKGRTRIGKRRGRKRREKHEKKSEGFCQNNILLGFKNNLQIEYSFSKIIKNMLEKCRVRHDDVMMMQKLK